MTDEERKALRTMLIQSSMRERVARMYQQYPSGLVTTNEIGDFLGRANNYSWRSKFVAGLQAYKDPCSSRKKYLIEDVILRTYDLEAYDGKEED